MIIDTSELSGRQLRERLYGALDLPDDGQTLALQLISFGYKHGIPLEADMVFDSGAKAGGAVAHRLLCYSQEEIPCLRGEKGFHNTRLSINRVFPTRAATTTNAPREISAMASREPLSTISK